MILVPPNPVVPTPNAYQPVGGLGVPSGHFKYPLTLKVISIDGQNRTGLLLGPVLQYSHLIP
jgi:hypothetical protein